MTHEESGAKFAAAQHQKTVELQAIAIKAKDDEIARLGIVVADQRATIAGMVAPAAPSEQARPTVKQLAAQLDDDKPWTRAEQDAIAVFLARFPNESSQGIISLGDAWKAGRQFEAAIAPAAPLPDHPEQSRLPDSARNTLEEAANKLVTYSRIYTGDKQALRIVTELRELIDLRLAAPLPELTGPSIGDDPKFNELLANFYTTAYSFAGSTPNPATQAALVAYIDSHSAASPSPAPAPTDTEALEMLTRVLRYIDPRAVDAELARTGPMEDAYINTIARKCVERLLAKAETAPAPTEAQQTLPHEQAPPNSLPNWGECALRVENSDFTAKRMAEGGYGAEADSKLATQLHRFIFEYDDADSFRSVWFMHRLELTIEEAKRMGGITSKESAETAAPGASGEDGQ